MRLPRTTTRTLQCNVLIDGLPDTPANVSFSPTFTQRLDRLLRALAHPTSSTAPFRGFAGGKQYRLGSPFSPPPVVPLDSTATLLGCVDLLYSSLYHSLGGAVRLGASGASREEFEALPAPDLDNALRTLFLHSEPIAADDANGGDQSRGWHTPAFESWLEKAAAGVGERDGPGRRGEFAEGLRRTRDAAFCPRTGSLTWRRARLERMWKRGENLYRDKWNRNMLWMLAKREGQGQSVGEAGDGGDAQRRFVRRVAALELGVAPSALVEVVIDESTGDIEQFRTHCFASALEFLLTELCRESLDCDRAARALAEFAADGSGGGTGGDISSMSASMRAALVVPPLLAELRAFSRGSALTARHPRFLATVARLNPGIITAVEFDNNWARMPPPPGYRVVRKRVDTGAVLYREEEFEEVALGVDGESGVSLAAIPGDNPPKSYCVALLRRRADGVLFLVAAAHLESGEPRLTEKVEKRARQLSLALAHLARVAAGLSSSSTTPTSPPRVCVFGGDFNALREEFVFGNSAELFRRRPERVAPRDVAERRPPTPPVARLREGQGDEVEFLCGSEGLVLREGSWRRGDPAAPVCTYVGNDNYVIDYIAVGAVPGGGVAVELRPVAAATREEQRRAADAETGMGYCIREWGSDHLPVTCDIHTTCCNVEVGKREDEA